jgi:hypothetical protein
VPQQSWHRPNGSQKSSAWDNSLQSLVQGVSGMPSLSNPVSHMYPPPGCGPGRRMLKISNSKIPPADPWASHTIVLWHGAQTGGRWRARRVCTAARRGDIVHARSGGIQIGAALFDHDLLYILKPKCTKLWIQNMLILLPSTTSTKAHRGFEQQVLHKLLAYIEFFSTPVNSTQLQLTKFFTIFHSKFEMPPKSKVVSL